MARRKDGGIEVVSRLAWQAGVVLGIVSKNEEAVALEAIARHPDGDLAGGLLRHGWPP